MTTTYIKRLVIANVIAVAGMTPVKAQEVANLAGAFAELHLPVRAASMGGAYTAFSQDGSALLYNPAAANFSRFAALSAVSTRLFDVVPASYVGFVMPMRGYALIGGVQQVGDDLLKETTLGIAASMTGSKLLRGGWASRIPMLENMAFSMSLRVLLASFGKDEDGGEDRVQGDGRGAALDFGYYLKLNGIRVGATWQNAIGSFRWQSSARGNYVQNFPARLKFGVAYVEPKLRLTLDIAPSLYSDVHARIYAGSEFNLKPWLVVRFGLAQNTGGLFQNKIVSAGFGLYNLTWRRYRLAIQTGFRSEELDQAYRLSLDFFWPRR